MARDNQVTPKETPLPQPRYDFRCKAHEQMVLDIAKIGQEVAVLNERSVRTLDILERQEQRYGEAERRREDETTRIRTQQNESAQKVARHSGSMSASSKAVVVTISILAIVTSVAVGVLTIVTR